VYFDTNRATLRAESRDALNEHAKLIIDHPEWGVLRIDGHCDERGSDPHNLALGRARARVVELYLLDLGVTPSRLATSSFGSGQPAVRGHDEGAWRYNRRTELRSGKGLASM
jgi:peptidoglycan-associated lipoprotein